MGKRTPEDLVKIDAESAGLGGGGGCGLKSPGEISQERAWSGERRDPRAKSGGLSTVQDAAEEGGICLTLTVNASLNLHPKHFTCLHLVPSLLAREE